MFGNLSVQLKTSDDYRVVYNASGSYLKSAVVSSNFVASHNLYWASFDDPRVSHYLAALLNAGCLRRFFRESCQASDKDFMLLPIKNLPIPAFDPANVHHANLAAQSELAHQQVTALVAEYAASRRKINRDAVLRDPAMQPILASIDQSVKAILPD